MRRALARGFFDRMSRLGFNTNGSSCSDEYLELIIR